MDIEELKNVINDYNYYKKLCKGSKFDLCYCDLFIALLELIEDSTNVIGYIERNYVKRINVVKYNVYRYK